jgi:uncharacterized protein YciI
VGENSHKPGPRICRGAWSPSPATIIIEAEDLDAAERIAQDNPYIASIRVYEIRSI